MPLEPGAPNFFHFAAQACNTTAFVRQKNFDVSGGASVSRERAVAKAIGEAVERYCAAIYDIEELSLSDSNSLAFPHVEPEDFALYSDDQFQQTGFPWVKFDSKAAVRWTPAVDLSSGEELLVPAALVFVPYHFYRGSGDSPIAQPISTGLACHTNPAQAVLTAICEVIERDAFTITWQAEMAMPQIRVETLSDSAYDLVERFERTGGKIVLLNLAMDHGVPTILSVLRTSAPEGPALVFAAATSLDPERAVCSALEELAHTRRYSQQIKSRMRRLVTDASYSNVIDQVDHLNLYCDHDNMPLADFIFSSSKRIDFHKIPDLSRGDPEQDVLAITQLINGIGHRVLMADITTSDAREVGVTVVRALIPGFHPLFMGHAVRALGGRRLWEVPQKLGCIGGLRNGSDNPAAHPYP